MIHSCFEACQKQSLHQVPIPSPTLIMVKQGEKRIYNGRDELRLPAGRAVVLPAGIAPEMENIPADGRYAADLFSPPRRWQENFGQQYGELLTDLPARQASFVPDPALESALQQCRQPLTEGGTNPAWQSARLELAWHQVLLELIRLQAAAAFFQTSNQPLADRLRELISYAPSQEWQAGKVAQQLNMSPATLRRRLQAEGTSFSTLLQESRMAQALGLVLTTPSAINEIAWQCGYDSPTSFSHAFKKHFAVSPTELRATQQE
ncbi:AraC family transcriptional regulator [Thiothrix nivea]|uniref:Transcriptional regulator, AraC family n=1 Tax=Thiothrix nivea (strain ATCC 35100 / DSM 5205 / JP2) TaxID=870187 RepID=A0A656HEY1_THINJ|nr:AraC family transcriptional regulator [Thiothrix nivea]EIJ34762.1 transcriptional regulator, AraC family [Thiothrix nivea DSM 5205]